MIMPVTILPPSSDIAVAEEDVLLLLNAALHVAHVHVAAAKVLHHACSLPRTIIPTTLPLFLHWITLMDHLWHCPLMIMLPQCITPFHHCCHHWKWHRLIWHEAKSIQAYFRPLSHPNNFIMSRVQLECSACSFLIAGPLRHRS
jgi:hypothetical protein